MNTETRALAILKTLVDGDTRQALTAAKKLLAEINLSEDMDKQQFERLAAMFDYPAEWWQKSFMDNGRKYTIIGVKPNARKSPLQLRREDGKLYKAPVNYVRRFMA